ncbi:MAG: cobyric acid synthase [Pseudomonadota bacterium]
MTKAIMIQGAGSNVGKSVLVAGLCRAAVKRGLRVAPFKPQNMSNNAAVTEDGGEIGRAQALQARAAGLRPHTDMNPVLLKPESDVGAQVVVQGQRLTTLKARDYGKMKSQLLPAVLESFDRLKAKADLIIVEGAGSPAEVNLRAGDIANMGFATAAGVPVALIGDIDRGGVIAQLVGTHAVLPQSDRDMIKAFAINKFRGDTRLFDAGMTIIADHTGWSSCGIIPWFADAWRLPAEDVMDIASRPGGPIKIAVPKLNRIANFDDLDPLSATPEVTIEIVEAGRALPGDADLILIPGSKSTIADLAHFRAQGWDVDLRAHVQRGGRVLGICGGYQMLGQTIADPDGIEGEPQTVAGLGLLNVDTVMTPHKHLTEVSGHEVRSGAALTGYEIHIGETTGPDSDTGWITLGDRREGAESMNGHIQGCYLHGLFSGDVFREAYLSRLGTLTNGHDYEAGLEDTLDQLAAHLETHMDVDALLTIAEAV